MGRLPRRPGGPPVPSRVAAFVPGPATGCAGRADGSGVAGPPFRLAKRVTVTYSRNVTQRLVTRPDLHLHGWVPMAAITIACPSCGAKTPLGDDQIGRRIQCTCGMAFSASPVFAVPNGSGKLSG